jgi:hypothetical protein
MIFLKTLLKKKYIQFALFLFLLELVASFYLKAYYLYFFEKNTFELINTEITIYYFDKTMKHLFGNVDSQQVLVGALTDPSHYVIKIIPCRNDITKIILLPSSFERIGLYDTNLKGCCVIETYFFNDEQIQQTMKNLFNNIYKQNDIKLEKQHDIVMHFNETHYRWINFELISNPLLNLAKINPTDSNVILYIKQKTIFSWQSITMYILHRSINFYYFVLPIFIK